MPDAESAREPAGPPFGGTADGAALCRRCGLCCDGTLFGHVRLEPAAEAMARRRGLLVVSHQGKPTLAQRCAALEPSGRCSVYHQRPRRCAGYRCKLLDQHQAGEVDLPAASAIIDRVRTSFTALRDRLGEPDASLSELRSRLAEQDAASVAWRRANAELLMDLVAFQRLCDRHLLRPRAHPSEPPAAEG